VRSLRRFFKRLTSWATTRRDEERLQAEIEEHLALQTADNLQAGLSPADARREAVLRFGGVAAMKDTHREQRGLLFAETLIRDFRHAVRVLLSAKGWTTVVLASLALGLGANTALFSAVNAVILETVAVPKASELVRLKWAGSNDAARSLSDYGVSAPDSGRRVRATVSYFVFQRLRQANETMADLTAYAPMGGLSATIGGQPEFVSGIEAAGNYFDTLQIGASLGRVFHEADDRASAPLVGVISDAFWHRTFGGSPGVVGRTITVNNQSLTIIGVTPASLGDLRQPGNLPPDLTVPLAFDGALNHGDTRLSQPTSWWLLLFGRLKPSTTPAQVQANLEGPFRAGVLDGTSQSARSMRQGQGGGRNPAVPTLLVSSGAHGTYDPSSNIVQSVELLGSIVVVILLIVCANVASLLLSRARSRLREVSIRLSVGATRIRLVCQLLVESIVLSGTGGLLGVAVALWLRSLLPLGITIPLDWRVFGFVAGLSLLTGLAFGLVPALRTTRVELADAMKESSRAATEARSWLSKGLLVVQVALAMVLLVGAGLFLRTVHNLERVDVGVDPKNLLMFSVNAQLAGIEPGKVTEFYDDLSKRVGALPGVGSLALTQTPVLSGAAHTSAVWVDTNASAKPTDAAIYVMNVSREYFTTMDIPVVEGRAFDERDTSASPKVVLLNRAAERDLFHGQTAMGRRIGLSASQTTDFEIVGVAHDTKDNSVRDAPPPTVYYCARQGMPMAMSIVARTTVDAASLIPSVRTVVHEEWPTLSLGTVTTLVDQLSSQFGRERTLATVYSLFGALALLLASIGLLDSCPTPSPLERRRSASGWPWAPKECLSCSRLFVSRCPLC
jgi:predicted permease